MRASSSRLGKFAGGPSNQMVSSKYTKRWAVWSMAPISWEIMTIVLFCSWQKRSKSLSRELRDARSIPTRGSSSKRRSASLAKALAITALWRSPPESWFTSLCAKWLRPTISMASSILVGDSACPMSSFLKGHKRNEATRFERNQFHQFLWFNTPKLTSSRTVSRTFLGRFAAAWETHATFPKTPCDKGSCPERRIPPEWCFNTPNIV